MDRAGLSPNDGATHHGLFDISYLRSVPYCVLMAPSNEDELADMIATGLNYDGPAFIRYPRGNAVGKAIKPKPEILPLGKAERLQPLGQIDIWAYGTMLADAEVLAESLRTEGYTVGLVNARFAKPLDTAALLNSAENSELIVTLEDHVISGGFGSAVLEALQEANSNCPMHRLGWPDEFIEHGSSVSALRAQHGLDPKSLFQSVLKRAQAAISIIEIV
jgi:1-deoxy-D-xylulose-5-phosphate synthase